MSIGTRRRSPSCMPDSTFVVQQPTFRVSCCTKIPQNKSSAPMQFELCRTIPADHPSLPGHFPDAPIVPAVVILDEVIAALAEWRGQCQLTAIPTVKFLAPLKPDQP